MRVTAPAKLNLRLAVLAREAGGYHQIETIFCRTSLADTLEIELRDAGGMELHVEGADVGPHADNLVVRAAHAFADAAHVPLHARIALHKRIPAGAGLGGGSSDAAATLHALNTLHGDVLDSRALLAVGARLGSDVPFFLTDAPLALAWGRGERMLALPALPAAPALIVVPERAVSTADAYRRLSETLDESPRPAFLDVREVQTWDALARVAYNDFERVVLPAIPALEPALAVLREHGALIAQLTGSGSAIFGVFESERARDTAQAAVASAHPALQLFETEAGA